MDGDRFDALTRALGGGRSRRGVLKGLGAAALGAAGLSRLGKAEAANLGNSPCAHFCQTVFPPGPDRGACVSDAAHGTGMCYQCGPAAPAGNGQALCGTACVDITTTSNCGACGNACPAGDACNAPVCNGGACGTAPANEGGDCTAASGAPGTCQSGTCVADICVGTTPGTAQCASDGDCASGQSCQNGGCFTPCSGSCGSCLGGCTCSISTSDGGTFCHDFDLGIGSCHSNADCPPGSVCDATIVNGNFSANLCTRPCATYQPAV